MARTCPYPDCGYAQLSNSDRSCPSCGKPIYYSGSHDFTELIVDRTHDFTGRYWVFEKVETWLTNENGKRVHFLSGGPGSGKSAVAARLVQLACGEVSASYCPTLAKAGVAYFHFCQAQNEAVIEPLGFVKSLSLALSDRFEAFALALTQVGQQHPEIHVQLEVGSTATGSEVIGVQIGKLEVSGLSPRRAFAHLVREPLEALVQSGEKAIILILIDALDEALTFDPDENLATLLADVTDHPKDLPRQVRFLVTGRPDPRVVELLGEPDLDLIDNAPADQQDVLAYAEMRLEPALADPIARIELASGIATAGLGNFLYARYVIDDLLQHPVDPTVLTLPPGLNGVYEDFLKRELGRQGRIWRSYRPLLGALVMARGSGLTRQQLAGSMNERASLVEELLEPCMQYLAGNFPDGPFRIYHQSFRDFLLGSEQYRLEADEVCSDLADYFWAQYISFRDKGTPLDDYTLANLPVHLAEAGRYEDLNSLHFNFGWLQAKLDRMGINALLTDFSQDQSPSDDSNLRVSHALQQGAYVLSQDPAQLASQLLGRMLDDEDGVIRKLLEQARKQVRRPCLLPQTASLRDTGALLHKLAGHSGEVTGVAVTPDGSRAVSSSRDRTLKVWDLVSGIELRTLAGHTRWVTGVAVTPDGTRAISTSLDRTLKVWDLESGAELRTLEGHTDQVTCVAVTMDGIRAVSGSWDGTLKVWDIESGEELHTLAGHNSNVTGVAVTPDGRLAVSASSDKTLKVWNLVSGKELLTLAGHTEMVTGVAVTPNGNRAVSASWDSTLKVWDFVSGKELRTLEGHTSFVSGVAVTEDGRLAVSASYDHTLKVWDLASGAELHTLGGHTNIINSVAVTKDGSRAVSASDDRTLKVWNLLSGKELRTLEGHTSWVAGVAVVPSGDRAISAKSDRTLSIWDLSSYEELHTQESDFREFNGLEVTTPDETRTNTLSKDDGFRIWDLPNYLQFLKVVDHTIWRNRLVVTSDGSRAIFASWDRTFNIWELKSGKVLNTLVGHTSWVNGVAVTPDGSRAVSASYDGILKVWDLANGEDLLTLIGHIKSVAGIVVTPDGKCVVSASDDHTLKVWDLERGEELLTMAGHTNGVRGVTVTADGNNVVSASADGTLKVWDLVNGEELHTLVGHTNWVIEVAVTLDGGRAVSASWDNTLKVWDLRSGKELLTLIGHTAEVTWVFVLPDGSRAISVSRDDTIKVWDLESGTCLTTFHADGALETCAVSPDGHTVVAAGASGRMHFLRLEEGT